MFFLGKGKTGGKRRQTRLFQSDDASDDLAGPTNFQACAVDHPGRIITPPPLVLFKCSERLNLFIL